MIRAIPRFMAYLSLFTFFMLMLVTADNFVQLFFGWEGVGLCSYLLIGFWYDRATANDAAIKAFIVNRVGDFGFALGIFAVFVIFGSLDFDTVFGEGAGGGRHDDEFPRLAGIVARHSPASCCSSARWGNRRRSGCTPGCPTRWRVRPRSRR